MTTILWDGESLSGDSRMLKHNRLHRDETLKLYSFPENAPQFKGHKVLAIGIAGACAPAQRAVDYLCKKGDAIEEFYRSIYWSEVGSTDFNATSFALLIVTDGPAYQLDVGRSRKKIPVELTEITELPHGIGSGGSIAQFLSAQYQLPGHLAVAGSVMGDKFSGGMVYSIGIKGGEVTTQTRHWYPDANEIRTEIAKHMRVKKTRVKLMDDPLFVQIKLPAPKPAKRSSKKSK